VTLFSLVDERRFIILLRNGIEVGFHDSEREWQLHGSKDENQAKIAIDQADYPHNRADRFRMNESAHKRFDRLITGEQNVI
jgi:hypothetical protein